jgi:hypothetical protein
VSKYLVRRHKPPSQTWRTFLDNHVKSMVSVDLFTVPMIRFQVLYVFLVLAMVLARSGSGFTGSVTESRIALNDDGGLLRADASEDTTPKPMTKARLEGSALHLTVKDGFEFIVILKDDTHAEIKPVGAPPNMKPIPAEKVH